MKARRNDTSPARSDHSRLILWIAIAIYTFLLPEVIVLYRAIVDRFGKETAGRVPVVLVLVVGVAYAAAIVLSRRRLENVLFLLPAGMIALMIIGLEPNPNKHIHIPEYVLAAWLLYAVLSKDYQGSGLLRLVFVCGALLGVVDELEQGIHPKRFYGWSDMLVNSASVLIGIFTIMGLKGQTAGGWAWTARLRQFRWPVALGLFGMIGITITCVYLFRVQARETVTGVYPAWLVAWNLLYLLSAPFIGAFGSSQRAAPGGNRGQRALLAAAETRTARLWILPVLVILLYMHALAFYIYSSGTPFR